MLKQKHYLGYISRVEESESDIDLSVPITEQDAATLMAAQLALKNYLQADLLPYVEYSAAQLFKYLDMLIEASNSRTGPSVEEIFMPARCSILTLLAALSIHNEQTHKKLTRQYEQDSSVAGTIEALRTEQYDSSFAYRFCIRLRNFVVHRDINIFEFKLASGTLATSGLIHGRTQVIIDVSRDDLLSPSETDVWSTVRKEIEQLDERIPLNDLFLEAVQAAQVMGARARALLFPSIRTSIEILENWRMKTGHRDGIPAIIVLPSGFDPRTVREFEVTMRYLNFEMIDSVKKIIHSAT